MSITTPPVAPPVVGTGGHGDGARGTAQVTRNVPPKRIQLLPGVTVSYAGHTYVGGDPGNDTFVHGEGTVADQLVLSGQAVILSHEEVDAWNGEEGDAIRASALKLVDAQHKDEGTKRSADHDHGFRKYSN